MSKKSAKTADDLVEQVLDDRVINALVTRLTACLTPVFEQLFDKLAKSFTLTLETLVEKTATEVAMRECGALTQKINDLEEENAALKLRVEEVAINYRMDNLVVHGLPESSYAESVSGATVSSETISPSQSNQETVRCVLNLCRDRLGVAIDESVISSAYRIPRGKKDAHRPIIVRLSSQRVRNSILAARKSLRSAAPGPGSAPIYINEHLTKTVAVIFARARAMQRDGKILAAWTMNGVVHIRRSDAPGDKPRKILTLKELEKI